MSPDFLAMAFLVSSEAVIDSQPDKVCDQVSDPIFDSKITTQDKMDYLTTQAKIDYETHSMAILLGKQLSHVRKNGLPWWLRSDRKTQVTIEYL